MIALAAGGCAAHRADPVERFEFTQLHMGVEARIVLYSKDEPTAARAAAAGFDRIASLDASLTDYRTDSELMRLCAGAGGPARPVGPDLFVLLQRARGISEASGGAFDVSIGPVVRLWRAARSTGQPPDPAALAAARALVDYRAIILDRQSRTVRLAKPGMILDLGGIGKGYAAQEALKILRARGHGRALVALAGDIALGDPPADQPGWSIALSGLGGESRLHHVRLANTCISTSGDREQFLEVDGRRYSHIINPGTAQGSTARAQITVISPDGATADALATAATLVPRERIMPMIAKFPGAAVHIQQPGDDGMVTIISSPNFPAPAHLESP